MDQQIGNYMLLHPLGQSDSSTVFLGEHCLNGTQAAIKLLDGGLSEEEAQMFLEKMAVLSQLQHSHIMAIEDFGVENGVAYIVMNYAAQGTLRERHPRGTRLSLASIQTYVESVAAALHYLHEKDIVHRDVKPHNLLIDDEEKILLSDFGSTIASYSLSPERAPLKDFEGTVLYAAPEQLRGRPCRASDQYALGVVVYEWLCGEWPFHGTFHEVVHQHLFVTPPTPSSKGVSCPANVEQVIMRSLEKDPRQRFPNIKIFADEFSWACKVAQARGDTPNPDTTPLALLPQDQSKSDIPPLELPTTPAQLSIVQATEATKRQFKSPLPFSSKRG